MKEIKKLLLMLIAVTVSVALATGCSNSKDDDDDDGGDKVTLAEKIEGTYNGTYIVNDFPDIEDDIEVKVIRTADKKVTLELGKISFSDLGSVKIPAITDIGLTGVTSSVGIVKSVDNLVVNGDFGGDIEELLNVSLLITGNVRSGTNMKLEIKLTSDDDPMGEYSPLSITVDTEKEKEDE